MSVFVIERFDGHCCPPALDDDGTESFLAWPTREQAEQGYRFQLENGYIDPVGWSVKELTGGPQ